MYTRETYIVEKRVAAAELTSEANGGDGHHVHDLGSHDVPLKLSRNMGKPRREE